MRAKVLLLVAVVVPSSQACQCKDRGAASATEMTFTSEPFPDCTDIASCVLKCPDGAIQKREPASAAVRKLSGGDVGGKVCCRRRGRAHGPCINWHPGNRVRAEAWEYRDGTSHGWWIRWDETGRKTLAGEYRDGIQHGTAVSWHPNGRRRLLLHYRNGNQHGRGTEWYPSGAKMAETEVRDGQGNGPGTRWHKNGTKAVEWVAQDGKPCGPVWCWDPEGAARPCNRVDSGGLGRVLEKKKAGCALTPTGGRCPPCR